VTYGRSGSTLLQGLLNSIDGVLIRGENFNFCFGLYQSYQSLVKAKEKAQKSKADTNNPVSPWFGALGYDLTEFKQQQAKAVKHLLVGESQCVKCYGFKEVRYDSVPSDEFSDYMAFLKEIFPDMGVIFNVRNLDEVLKSGWWKNRKHKEAKKILMETEKRFLEYASTDADCFVIRYSDVVNKTEVLNSLYDFIGATYNEARIDTVLSKPHSYDQSKNVLEKLKQVIKGN
tara:strand:+ start:6573 stop:7262 length:690 start_codon:yes stop_codon:yes gene_type:complete